MWEEPVPTEITLEVTPDYAIAGSEFQTLTATVLDQFGDPMPNVVLTVNSTRLEGNHFNDSRPFTRPSMTARLIRPTRTATLSSVRGSRPRETGAWSAWSCNVDEVDVERGHHPVDLR